METARVQDIWWVERDPWGRYVKWHGDGQGLYRAIVHCVKDDDGVVHIVHVDEERRVSEVVWQRALQRALRNRQVVLVTDAVGED
jgi:hypothetical protein